MNTSEEMKNTIYDIRKAHTGYGALLIEKNP
jgi:hypothetical protein